MEFIDFSGAGYQESATDDAASEINAQPYNPMSSSHLADPTKPPFYAHALAHGMSCDIKPRLTKDQHDILEDHFQRQPKPNTNTKKQFAEQLGVSLDKVNNWFQNRRAKQKQDAKKAAGSIHFHPTSQDSHSESQTSPGLPPYASDYNSMLHHWNGEQQLSNGLGISQSQQIQEQGSFQHMPFDAHIASSEPSHDYSMSQQYPDFFDNDPEMNRRTLTQEGFNASAQNDNLMTAFNGDRDIMDQIFPNWQGFSKQDVYSVPHPIGAPLSSIDSTVPSSVSDQSMPTFPSSSMMQHQSSMSGASSEWAESRSSSVQDGASGQNQSQHGLPATSSQWQPGQSIPVDFNVHLEEFRRARAAQSRTSTQQQEFEQPLAWPADEAYLRRQSSASLLTQGMSNVGIETPYTQQAATFKSPAPPTSIALRRQRPTPASLGLASLRSQSYSGVVPPESPRQFSQAQQLNLNTNQNLRRIRSSNVLGGVVASGRVMKSMPGSAQRSPLSYSFADAMNSPHAIRHPSQSQGNLAPPTPMSPSEFPRPEQPRQAPTWYAGPPQTTRHASISENELDQFMQYRPSASVPAQNWSSPPHTPMYYQQQFVQPRVGNNVITENTPPQSAPASQTCFQTNSFVPHQQHMQSAAQQQQMFFAKPQQPQYVGPSVPDQQFQMSNVTFLPNQQANISTSGPAPGVPLQFTNGVPVMNAEGTVQLAFPNPQVQVMQSALPDMHASPQIGNLYAPSSTGSPHQSSKNTPQPASDFFVHEYTPPDGLKRASTPRKAVDSGPKNFTFANSGPVDFVDKKGKSSDSRDSITSGSPSSTSGSIASSS